MASEIDPQAFSSASRQAFTQDQPLSIESLEHHQAPSSLQSGSAFGVHIGDDQAAEKYSKVAPELAMSGSLPLHQTALRKKLNESETDNSSVFAAFKSSLTETPSSPVAGAMMFGRANETINEELKEADAKTPEMMPDNLRQMFELAMADLAERPIEYYESLLYDITRMFAVDLGGRVPKLESIEMFHPLMKLQDKSSVMSEEQKQALEAATENLIENHVYAQLDYRLLKLVTDLISGLLVKWKLIRPYEYSYRYREAVFSSKLIDIQAINQGYISMEVLYFSSIANKPPLKSSLHQTVKQYANLVLSNALEFLENLLQLTNADFNRVPSISGYLSAVVNPDLALKYGFVPVYGCNVPEYHKLRLKTGCLALCMSSQKEKVNLALKERLIEFEMAYRYFETVLVKDLGHLKSTA
jgi:hypothetical protein